MREQANDTDLTKNAYRIKAGRLFGEDRGVILATTLVFMLTMALMVTSFLDLSAGETRELTGRIDIGRAFWFAEAGLHKAQWMITTLPVEGGGGEYFLTPPGGITESLDEGSYHYTITMKGQKGRIVVSEGFFRGYTYKVQQEFNVISAPFPPAPPNTRITRILKPPSLASIEWIDLNRKKR